MARKIHKARALRRRRRVRFEVKKNSFKRYRLTVFRSSQHIYAQIVDDTKGETLVTASTVEKDVRAEIKGGGNIEAAKVVGRVIAEKAKAKNILKLAFDRGSNLYHGRTKALAEAARAGGLDF